MIDRGYLHGGRGPPCKGVSTDLERDMLSGVIPYKDMPCFVSKFILHSLTLAGEGELTNKKNHLLSSFLNRSRLLLIARASLPPLYLPAGET